MRLLLRLVLLLGLLPTAVGQKFNVTWLSGCTVPDSVRLLTLSSNQLMNRVCAMTTAKGSTARYLFISDKLTDGTWSPPYIALTLKSFAMQARISADGNRIFLLKEIDEYAGDKKIEVSPGVFTTTNQIGIYVSELLEGRNWGKPRFFDDYLVVGPAHSFSISPDENHLVFSQLFPRSKSKVNMIVYQSDRNEQNRWGETRQVTPKGIELAMQFDDHKIAAADILYYDNDKILISAKDGNYQSKMNGKQFGAPVKLPYFGRLDWINLEGTYGLINDGATPLKFGWVELAKPTVLASNESLNRQGAATGVATTSGIKPNGKYYAVLIGVSQYKLSTLNLDRPVKDARELKDVLTKNYMFDESNVQVLSNPSRQQIINLLFNLRKVITHSDNLLIFYAGHGFYDQSIKQGYWWPSDATPEDPSNWLSNSDLREQIRGIPSAHTLLISDACFSGGIFRTRGVEQVKSAPMEIQILYKTPSRRAITSGNMSSVPDQSVFFQYLTKRLNDNTEPYLSSEELYSRLKMPVINNSMNIPEEGVIQDAGDEVEISYL